jgi:hypothetical protein
MEKSLLIEFGIIKNGDNLFTPYFTIDNQTFKLESQEDKKSAIFFANSLIEAFNKLPNSKTKRIKYK